MAVRRLLERNLNSGSRAELYEREGGAPEIFIDGAWGAAITSDGIFKVNLFTRGIGAKEGVERQEIAVRLVMTGNTLNNLRKYFDERFNDMVQRGIIIEQAVETPPQKTARRKSTTTKRQRSKTK